MSSGFRVCSERVLLWEKRWRAGESEGVGFKDKKQS